MSSARRLTGAGVDANRALVLGTWAFILEPVGEGRTRLLIRERDSGWLRLVAPGRSGLLRAATSLLDYVIAEPLHFAMVRKMMLGLKQRAERVSRDMASEPAAA